MGRLPSMYDVVVSELLSKTLDERLDEIAPKAVREARRATCRHEAFDMRYQLCRHCGMTPMEAMRQPQRFN